jgi:putative transposase
VRNLQEYEPVLNVGTNPTEVLQHLELTESSWNRRRSQHGGMKANGAKRLEEFEAENAHPEKLPAEAELHKAMLKELAEREWWPRIVGADRAPSAVCEREQR